MPITERSRGLSVDWSGLVDLAGLEEAAVEFARTAPRELMAAGVQSLMAQLLDVVVGPAGQPVPAEAQGEAPWACTKCGSRRGFRRRGQRQGGRSVTCAVGRVLFGVAVVECLACDRRFVPAVEVLGLAPYQRISDTLARLAAGLATEVAYAKAARLLGELAGVGLSPRQIRRQVLGATPTRLGPDEVEVPIVLLDGTGVRAGRFQAGVELHLAIGLVARRRAGTRVSVEARLLGATLNEPWAAMEDLLAQVRPGLIIVDGEEELSELAGRLWPAVPVQRCLFHLAKRVQHLARYTDRVPLADAKDLRRRFHHMLTDAYRHPDLDRAQAAYDQLTAAFAAVGAPSAARHLAAARPQALTFLTHPHAGRLIFGDKGRPELATGVLERVMREMNRRTDVGVRWSIPGARAILMAKLARKYAHPAWPAHPAAHHPPAVRITPVA